MSAPTADRPMLSMAALDAAQGRSSRADEQALLGALMLASADSATPAAVREKLRPGPSTPGVGEHHFTSGAHKLLWQTIVLLMDRGDPHDALSIAAELDAAQLQHVGGVPYLHTCVEACPTVANATHYARNVASATLLRGLAENAARTTQQVLAASLNDAEEVLDRARSHLATIEIPGRGAGPVTLEDGAVQAFEEIERLQQVAADPALGDTEFSTPWPDLDRLVRPGPGELLILAGRPGMAKSTMARGMAQWLGKVKRLPTLFFSLEMSQLEISMALMCEGARLRTSDVKHGTLDDNGWLRAAKYLGETKDAPLEIDDTAGANLAYVDRQLASFARRHGRPPVAFFVDYVQLSDERGHGSRQEAVAAMSRGYKLLAKKYSTVCVLLSQLNRGPEQRADKLPQLSDLRESGGLEQDADAVILLHRDDYYDKESPRAGELDLIIAKHRNGPTDTVPVLAQLHMSRIVSFETRLGAEDR